MSKAIFPRILPDGSFCVELIVAVSDGAQGDLASLVQGWLLNIWMPANQEWVRVWNRGMESEETEVLRYSDDFSAAPHIIGCEGSQLRLRLLGKSPVKTWRDWLASRILPDLKRQFPIVGELVKWTNCDAP